nr:PREDICTED: zinc finger protein 260-like [Bemisia tabaci]
MEEGDTIEIADVNELCRTCGTRLGLVLAFNIFDKEGSVRQIFEKILACLPIKISNDDKLPKLVCEECVYKLDLLYDFREKSIKTESLLTELVSKPYLDMSEVDGAILVSDMRNDPASLTSGNQLIPVTDSDITTTFVEDFNPNDVIEVHPVIVTSTVEVTAGNEMVVPSDCHNYQFIKVDNGMYMAEDDSRGDVSGDDRDGDTGTEVEDPKVEVAEEFQSVETVVEISGDISEVMSEMMPGTDKQTDVGKMVEQSLAKIEGAEAGTWLGCDICGKIFQNKESFQKHYEQHWCRCSNCGLVFADNESLVLHCEQAHPNETKEAEAPNSSKKKGGKGEPKPCPHCGKRYRSNFKLQEHMRKHTGEKPYQCTMCEKTFRSKIGLAQHEAKHTGNFEYSCSTCGKGFQCKSYLIVHQRVHSDVKPFPCTTCGRNFKSKQSLLDHQNRHLGVKPYSCEICGRGFITKGLCKSHLKVHSGADNRQFPCNVCNKMFVSKSYLNTHMRIHTGEKPYMCEVCGKGFLTRVDLRIHSTMHTGEKSFVCETCGKAFARRDALRCHKRSHTGERPYRCEICGQTFTQFSPMAIHKRLHTGERPYKCDVCGKGFVSRSTLTSHSKKHTP